MRVATASASIPFGKSQSLYVTYEFKRKTASYVEAWVIMKFFVEWINLVFGPSVKKHLQENHLPMQASLVLDNAPAHPPNFEEFKFIKVLYLPPNTTPILQPIDRQVISNLRSCTPSTFFGAILGDGEHKPYPSRVLVGPR